MAGPTASGEITTRESTGKFTLPWWVQPTLVVGVLGTFGLYAFWAALQGAHYEHHPYLSPLYSPLLASPFPWLSPAFLILWIPLGFRASCYYYRKAYYRSFFWDPPGCSIKDLSLNSIPHKGVYHGETSFPWYLNNLHRFFLYFTIVVVAFLWWDAVLAFDQPTADGGHSIGVGVGTIVLTLNALFLSFYTFGCHSFRHLVGGELDCFTRDSVSQARLSIWKRVTSLNERHQLWAWVSLFSVWFADVYVRLLSMGIIHDVRLI
ncbi:MAG TPA: succinate dehydrogenase [Candidatus Thermoplasmatota archaeon]|nr:succinate dehydrogenase [Candidatus Thermoplasmatota archaeon]